MINSQWLEPPMSKMNFHGVRAIEVRLYTFNLSTSAAFLEQLISWCVCVCVCVYVCVSVCVHVCCRRRVGWGSFIETEERIWQSMPKNIGDTRVRTGDLSICSRMLYHWAISPWKLTIDKILTIYIYYQCCLNPYPAEACLCKQCRSRSVGFWRSQLIWICTVCHSVYQFM